MGLFMNGLKESCTLYSHPYDSIKGAVGMEKFMGELPLMVGWEK